MGENIGYVRVSTDHQEKQRQILKMQELGVEDRFLFEDEASGKNFNRVGYEAMCRVLRKGDLLYIDSVDRLGRDYDDVIKEWKRLTREVGVDIVALDKADVFDSRKFRAQGDVGKLLEDQMLSIFAWVAEQERKNMLRRQREAINAAPVNERGKKISTKPGKGAYGRPRAEFDEEKFAELYKKWKAGNIKAVDFMKEIGLSKNTFYLRVKDYEAAAKL